ncbi:MAG: polyprenyl synthetase family protein [Eubacterium sp.]|nr:polyprenyl synthetase family protein [Eubacterium sp.]
MNNKETTKQTREMIKERAARIEQIIARFLPEETGYQRTVLSAMNYTMNAGGKRLRPMLMEETFKMYGGEDRDLIEPFMAAIEMIHTYSLIHDDLPALDNDDYRRGRKTAHVVYGEAMAILAGDALLNYAFETAAKAFQGNEKDIQTAKAMQVLTRKPGIYGMIGGQTADVELEGQTIDMDTLLFIHENKTAALIECAMLIGAILAGAPEPDLAVIEQIGSKVGLAFQIQDDILDKTSTTEELGKPVGSDEKNAKNTYVSIKGLDQARIDQERLTREAIDLFGQLGGQNTFLKELLLSLTNRTH